MRVVLVNEYSKTNKNGQMQTNYVYRVIGTPEELAKFAATESAKTVAKEDDPKTGVKKGDHLWITSSYIGESETLVITKANRVAVDTSQDRKIVALGNRMGKAGEKFVADYFAKKLGKGNGSQISQPETSETAEANADLSLDKLN